MELLSKLLESIKGLSLTNVAVLAILVVVAIPAYSVYKMLNDVVILDRLMSSYKEVSSQVTSCTVRETKLRGGPPSWNISTGFAYHGGDRYVVAVALGRQPSDEEMTSYCATLKLIADTLVLPH